MKQPRSEGNTSYLPYRLKIILSGESSMPVRVEYLHLITFKEDIRQRWPIPQAENQAFQALKIYVVE